MKHLTTIAVLFVCLSVKGQIKDTVPVMLLVADTMHYTNYTPQLNKGNYFDKSGDVSWVKAYSVREKHNEAEGLLDPYMCGNCVYKDYWQHLYYLDANKKPLSKSIIVWLSK
jgi:hypothetical protein